ncbi:hypothetical protein QOT17_021206 [Balamuthia mandrillaris]
MYGRTALVVLALLLVAAFAPQQALAGVNLNALLDGKVEVEAHLDALNAKLLAAFATTLGEPFEFSVHPNNISVTIDTSAFEEGMITWEASVLNGEGFFEGSLSASYLSLGAQLVINEEYNFPGLLVVNASFVVTLSARFEAGAPVFSFEEIAVTLSGLDFVFGQLSSSILDAAEESVTALIDTAFSPDSEPLTEFGNSLVAVVNDGLQDVVGGLPRVNIAIDTDRLADRGDVVDAIVTLLADLDIGDFANGIMIGTIAEDNDSLTIEFWILDNEDNVSGADAVAGLEEAYESNPEAFAFAGVNAFQVTHSTDGSEDDSDGSEDGVEDGDGSPASRLAALLF